MRGLTDEERRGITDDETVVISPHVGRALVARGLLRIHREVVAGGYIHTTAKVTPEGWEVLRLDTAARATEGKS